MLPLINFIANPSRVRSPEDLELLRSLSWEDGVSACEHHMWTWVTYRYLSDHTDLNVLFSAQYLPGTINIITPRWASKLGAKPHKFFTVSARADLGPFPYANLEVVQNKAQEGARAFWIPHWTQQGLIPRDPSRRDLVNIGYFGNLTELSIDLAQFKMDLGAMGCCLVHRANGEWQNMHDVDICIGIRSFDRNPHYRKPCTKLRNAWRAGIPFIGSCDSAYAQVGEPGTDYLQVESYKQLLDSIRLLQTDSQLYASLVHAGYNKIQRWSDEEVLRRWVAFLQGPCLERYINWTSHVSRERLRGIIWRCAFLTAERTIRPLARPVLPKLKSHIGLTKTGVYR